MKEMKALVYDGRNTIFDRHYPVPEPVPDEALIRIRMAGVCNTDVEIQRGYLNFQGVLGHEFVGELPDGRRVVGEINTWDNTCPACLRGDITHCENRTSIGILGRSGAFAEYMNLPYQNLHPIPENISDRQAVFVEPLAAAVEILEQVHVRPTQKVGVIGDGKLGILCAQVMDLFGAQVTAIGRHKEKLEILARRGIVTTTEPQSMEGVFDVVVECSGNQSGFEQAIKLLRPRGTLVLKSTFHGEQQVNLSPLVVAEIDVQGSRCGPFPPAIRLLEKGAVDVESLIEAEYPFDEAEEGFNHAQRRGAMKILFSMI